VRNWREGDEGDAERLEPPRVASELGSAHTDGAELAEDVAHPPDVPALDDLISPAARSSAGEVAASRSARGGRR
jgi:hypothetical protein